ncbi:HD-GYP domain-containing protein [Bacillus sp. HMF5848]|uniref:HD-GYP domain-containing protein n=1 Tax=Bacillus sp. HMF5848 TaxID=2495421 RepID=UPI000F779DB5|nr:HD-GYP domain-containing protein [Bacillus sp. HMF5848]RSK28710.1 HD-GYP domain-containing protein [Bacillus sp. HMF5848]
MNNSMKSTLLQEEKRAVVLYLIAFYFVFALYDFVYYFLVHKYVWGNTPKLPGGKLYLLVYAAIAILIPIAIYLFKTGRVFIIKYIYFYTYIAFSFTSDIYIYLTTDASYSSGNAVELIIVLFAPIFVDKVYYRVVAYGLVIKYAFIGYIIQDATVILPIVLYTALGIVSYIILNRFFGYVTAIKKSYDTMLEGMVKGIITTLELKDPYTRGHSERVAEYAQILAAELSEFTGEQLKTFKYSCLLHDIGKIYIHDDILRKPSSLTDEEYDEIKKHTTVGADAVMKIEGFEDHVPIVKYHHERWDGKGYPDGVRGEDIPVLARVTAIADAFDAMTSNRAYRNALSFEEAHRRLINGSGTQFDPHLVTYIDKVIPKWREVYKSYNSYEI